MKIRKNITDVLCQKLRDNNGSSAAKERKTK